MLTTAHGDSQSLPIGASSRDQPTPRTTARSGVGESAQRPDAAADLGAAAGRAHTRRRRLPRRELVVLMLALLAVGTSGHAVAGLVPILAAETGSTPVWAGQLAAVFAVVCAVAGPALAVATGRWERRRLLTACLLVTATGNALAAVASSMLALVVARVVTALGAAMTTAVAVGLAAAHTPPERRGRAMAMVLGGLTAALALGVPAVAALAYWAGFGAAMGAMAALCAVAAVAVAVAAPRSASPPTPGLRARLRAAVEPGVAGVLGAGLLAWASTGAVYPYLSLTIGRADGPVSGYLTVYGLGAAAGTWLGGRLVDRFGARVPLIAAAVTGAAALLLLPLPHTGVPATVVVVAAWGAAGWASTPALNAWMDRLGGDPARSAVLLALVGSVVYLGMGLGTVTGGLVVALLGVERLPLVAAAGSVAAAAVFGTCGRPPVRSRGRASVAFPVEVTPSWPLR